jgi:hypothetical protein
MPGTCEGGCAIRRSPPGPRRTPELYHHLESQRLVPATASFRIHTVNLGPLHLATGLPSLSEIAADRFAASLLGLTVPPRALAFIAIHALNSNYAWALLGRLQEPPA